MFGYILIMTFNISMEISISKDFSISIILF